MTNAHDTDPIENFIEQMGLISQSSGKPRIAGRIFGLLFIEGGPLSLVEMAERLQVSRASVSTNARLLADVGLLRRTSQVGDRQDFYELMPRLQRRIFQDRSQMMRNAAVRIAEAAALLADSHPEMGERVQRLARLYDQHADFIEEWSRRLDDEDFLFNSSSTQQASEKQ